MLAGCEFVCENDKCEHYKTGFVITGPWPIARIELVIEDLKVKENEPFRQSLIERRKKGYKYTCIIMPNNSKIPIEGYRFQKWCSECHCICNHIELFNDNASSYDVISPLEDVLEKGNIPQNCFRCNAELKDFNTITKKGIVCLHCGEKLKQYRWMSGE